LRSDPVIKLKCDYKTGEFLTGTCT